LAQSRIYSQDKNAAYRVIDGEAVVVNCRTAEVTVLNEVGSFIWEAISEPLALEDLVKRVAENFEVAAQEALEDTSRFLKDLADAGLLAANGD